MKGYGPGVGACPGGRPVQHGGHGAERQGAAEAGRGCAPACSAATAPVQDGAG